MRATDLVCAKHQALPPCELDMFDLWTDPAAAMAERTKAEEKKTFREGKKARSAPRFPGERALNFWHILLKKADTPMTWEAMWMKMIASTPI